METADRIERSIRVLKGLLIVIMILAGYLYSNMVMAIIEKPKTIVVIEDSEFGVKIIKSDKPTVGEVLEQVKVEVDDNDLVSPSLTEPIDGVMRISVVHQSIEVFEREVNIEKIHETIYDVNVPMFSEKVVEGQNGHYTEVVKRVVVQDNVVETIVETKANQELINDQTIVAPMQPGSYFVGKLTAYGVDCVGCVGRSNGGYGGLATGVPVSKYGVQDSGKITINIKGEDYFVLAADPSIPFCSVFSIENHLIKSPSGTLLTDVKGIVLDRGGGINGAHMDLFKGTEIDYGDVNPDTYIVHGTKNDTEFKMLKLGNGSRSCYKQDQPWVE